MTDTQPPAGFFLRALADQRAEEALTEALKIAVRRYYENYTDANDLSWEFRDALGIVVEETVLSVDLDELILTVERELHAETKRHFVHLALSQHGEED